MKIIVNGVGENIGSARNLSEFLREKEINHKNVVVELNGVILKGEEYSSTILCEEDSLEILRILGGG